MVWDVDTVVEQFGTDILIEQLEVDALLQRFIAGGIEDVVNYLVEQRLLIYITVAHNLLQRLRGLGDAVLIGTQNHGLGHVGGTDGKRFELEA